jgi:hypothetical protein
MEAKKRLTRKQLTAYLRECGVPIGDSTLDKLCMPAVNKGPPVAVWWGRRPLYDPADALVWAEARMRRDQTFSSRPWKLLLTQQLKSGTDQQQKEDERDAALGRDESESDVT